MTLTTKQIAKEAAADVAATNAALAAKGGVSKLTFTIIRNPQKVTP